MKTIKYPSRNDWFELLKRPAIESVELEKLVQQIVIDVQQNGDAALKKYTSEFDKVELLNLQVSEEEFSGATKNISEDLKKAIQLAKINIEKFHASQKESGGEPVLSRREHREGLEPRLRTWRNQGKIPALL